MLESLPMTKKIQQQFDEIEALHHEIHARIDKAPVDHLGLRRHLMIALEQYIRNHPYLRDSAE